MRKTFLLIVLGAVAVVSAQERQLPDAAQLQQMAARFAPTEVSADVSKLSANDRKVLAKLVEASRVIDALFLRQAWEGNESMLLDLVRDESPLGRARLHYFLINKGPWSRLDHNEVFIPGAPPKPGGANYYPSHTRSWRMNGTLRYVDQSPASSFFGYYLAGQTGRILSFGIDILL